MQTEAGFRLADTSAKNPLAENGEGDSFMFIPFDVSSKAEKEWERSQAAKLKYESKRPDRDRSKMDWRPFCFWDGEGPKDAGYALFGNSLGYEICKPFLSTLDCLELICKTATDHSVIHVWFGGNYDVSMILHDIGFRKLNQLKHHKKTIYRGYRIGYVSRKWLTVSNGRVSVKIYDVVSFFATNFQTAVDKFKIATPQEVAFLTTNKAKRNEFVWADIDSIKVYWRLELKLGVLLMDTLRQTFEDAGFRVTSWHGPGALARVALKRHHIEDAMYSANPNQLPKVLEIERINAVRYAFAGGRFEMIHGGLIDETIYNYDIRSAYPYFSTMLPNLAKGIWRWTDHYEKGKFGVYHIEYKASGERTHDRIYPLFDRRKSGIVCWPAEVEGWYWNPEAELVADDSDARFIEGWIFDEDNEHDRPFAWLEEYYAKRQLLKDIGNAAEYTFKLIINSVYGQLAQRTGWDERNRKAPRYHQLEWAGYITSACRAHIYRTASQLPSNALVSIDTDGIYTRQSLPIQSSTNLGGWDISVYKAGLFWQSGIYCLADEKEGWTKGKNKSRGIPKGDYSYEILYDHYKNGLPIRIKRRRFVGFGLALNGQFEELNTWKDEVAEFSFGGGNPLNPDGHKRYHNKRHCADWCDGDVHVFLIGLFRPEMSNRHKLPWLEALSDVVLTHDDQVMYDLNDLDDGEEWVWEYSP